MELGVSDDEGNKRSLDYELDPWSGLTFTLIHTHESNKGCPIARYESDDTCMGVYLYESREEAITAWNTRK